MKPIIGGHTDEDPGVEIVSEKGQPVKIIIMCQL